MPAKRVRGVYKNASAAALAPRKPLCAAAHAGGQPGPRLGCDSSRGPGELRRPRPQGGGGPRGQKGPLSYGGLFGPEHLLAARQTSPRARRPDRPRKGAVPSGWPPDAADADKMQGRPRPKGIKAGPCILPLHFGRGCGMALPPPGQPTGQGVTGSAGPQKRNKGACAGWQPAAPGASVPGVSDVEWLG